MCKHFTWMTTFWKRYFNSKISERRPYNLNTDTVLHAIEKYLWSFFVQRCFCYHWFWISTGSIVRITIFWEFIEYIFASQCLFDIKVSELELLITYHYVSLDSRLVKGHLRTWRAIQNVSWMKKPPWAVKHRSSVVTTSWETTQNLLLII